MHLAIVTPYPPAVTGIGQYGYHLSRTLAGSGAFERISVLTGRTAGSRRLENPANLTVERAWQPECPLAGWQVAARLRQLRPDLVWFNLGTTVFGRSLLANVSGLLVPGLARRLGFPCTVTMHEMVELADLRSIRAPGWRLAALGARWVTSAFTQADVVCLTLKRYSEWLTSHRPGVCAVYVPIGAYGHPQILEEPTSPELLFFTTLAPFKGLELLLAAYRRLQARQPGVRLTIAGVEHARFPGYAARLRQEYADLNTVRWLGCVPEEGLQEIFRRCQVVVLPYTATTGSSSVLYQAATWGRAVVASDLPELRASVEEAGLEVAFFKDGDVGALADALERMLRSQRARRSQVERNYQAILRYRPEETCRTYLRVFNLTLEARCSAKRIAIPANLSTEPA
jgi:glycosyltransferase involved in cell wall biosynthesis